VWFGRQPFDRTTGTRLAPFLASKSYDNDYNVLLARFPLSFLIRASVRLGFELYSIVKVLFIYSFTIAQKELLLASDEAIMLYKRAFRKEKEVVTFLIKMLKWNLAINLEVQASVVD